MFSALRGPQVWQVEGCSSSSARNRSVYLTFMGENDGYDSFGEPNYPNVKHAALQRVERAAGEARAMIDSRSFGNESSHDEGDSDY
jgi:hypothetical protein